MTRLQAIDAGAQAGTDRDQVRDEPQQFDGPWLTSQEACAYLRFTTKTRLISLYRFLKRNGIPRGFVGGRLRIAKRDLERAIEARHAR